MSGSMRKLFPLGLLVSLGTSFSSSFAGIKFFTDQQKNSILKHYNEIVQSGRDCSTFPRRTVEAAARGMYIYPDAIVKKKNKAELCESINEANREGKDPFVHDDSLTAWGNIAAERYGLSVEDIRSLQPGESFEVILMDRNVGDYLAGEPAGTIIDPKKRGFTYGRYTHKKDLTGRLEMKIDDNEIMVKENFVWEINLASLPGKQELFWGPIPQTIRQTDLDARLKVGWRGPAIRASDAENLPATVKIYDTWYDDYLPHRIHKYL